MGAIRAALLAVAVAAVAGCSGVPWQTSRYTPDYYQVTAEASYRAVPIPGTQRRVAQQDAEDKARRHLLQYIGSIETSPGQTVNALMSANSRLRAEILAAVRNSEVVDWKVNPQCGTVQVCMRVDLNRIRGIIAAFHASGQS